MRTALVTILLAVLAGCGYAPHKDPILVLADDPQKSARAEAQKNHDDYCEVLFTGSMEPVLKGGDWVVVHRSTWSDALLGHVVNYLPHWNGGLPVAHRLVSGNAKDGFVASGDNNPNSEPYEPVTEDKYVGEIVKVFRAK